MDARCPGGTGRTGYGDGVARAAGYAADLVSQQAFDQRKLGAIGRVPQAQLPDVVGPGAEYAAVLDDHCTASDAAPSDGQARRP